MRSRLENLLRNYQWSHLPWPLPLAHVTALGRIEGILGTKRLTPHRCHLFQEDLLYLSYGGIHYRPKALQTERPIELPIAFLFGPRVLSETSALYPFDSGAVGSGLTELTQEEVDYFLDAFRVKGGKTTVPCILVSYLYETNYKYLQGCPNDRCLLEPEPLPTLYNFLSKDMSTLGLDHRQKTIEAMIARPLPFDARLIWIGIPEERLAEIAQPICDSMYPDVPEIYTYRYHSNFNPSQICAVLEDRAAKIVSRYETLTRSGL